MMVTANKIPVPEPMALEVAAGEALSLLLGNKLVCMQGGGAADGQE